MKLIIGLGNPGQKYLNTRHNVGFSVLDAFAGVHNLSFRKKVLKPFEYVEFNGSMLIKSLTYMNNSGSVLCYLSNKFNNPEDLLVVCDNMDLPCGGLRIRKGGGDSGQKGLLSLKNQLGSQNFYRIYIGIGRPQSKDEVNDYVLKRELRPLYRETLDSTINTACSVLLDFMNNIPLSELQNVYTSKGIL